MKYCTNCNVAVHPQHKNCPLCGAFLTEEYKGLAQLQKYAENQDKIQHPPIKVKQKVNFLEQKFTKLLLAVCLLSFLLNVLISPDSNWSAYVVIGSFFVCHCITWPIAVKWKIQRQIKVDLLVVTLVAVALEYFITNKFDFFVVKNVLPWVYVAAILLVDALIIFRRYSDVGLFSTLIYATIYALLPQSELWIANAFGLNIQYNLQNAIILVAAILNLVVVLIVCTKSLKEEVDRKLHL